MNWPKWNPMWRRKWERTPGQYAISRVMSNFLAIATWLKRSSIQVEFSRNKKCLYNLTDCREYLQKKLK